MVYDWLRNLASLSSYRARTPTAIVIAIEKRHNYGLSTNGFRFVPMHIARDLAADERLVNLDNRTCQEPNSDFSGSTVIANRIRCVRNHAIRLTAWKRLTYHPLVAS
jgi:hypothetical protein